MKCCKPTCEVVDIYGLLVCSHCLGKAFSQHYSMMNAVWSVLSVVLLSIRFGDGYDPTRTRYLADQDRKRDCTHVNHNQCDDPLPFNIIYESSAILVLCMILSGNLVVYMIQSYFIPVFNRSIQCFLMKILISVVLVSSSFFVFVGWFCCFQI